MRFVVLALVAACSSGERASSKGSAGSAAVRSAKDPWAAPAGSADQVAIDQTELVVEHAGTPPLQALRYRVGSIDRELSITTREVSTKTTAKAIDTELAADMRYRWRCSPCVYQMTHFTVHGETDPFMKMAEQIGGGVDVTPDGTAQVSGSLFKTTPSTTALIEMAIVRFPPAPIGIGARWSVRSKTTRTTYALVAAGQDSATVDVDIDESEPDAVAHTTGRMEVSFADPIAKAKLTQDMTLTLDDKLDLPPFKMVLEIR